MLARGCDLFNAPTADQVLALAPDSAAARSGEALANARHWPLLGRSDRLVWGLCQGSGANPYQVVVDLAGPAFKCSCPSRKFPCKHGLGIMLLHATSPAAFGSSDPPPWASAWLASRDTRAAATEDRTSTSTEVDAAAQAKRAGARERKVDAGLGEFERWLRDLIRRGLVSAKGEGYGFWDAAGARLVDAQAGALGRAVRGFGGITNAGPAWGDRALEHAARLHLIVEGYRHLEVLPEPLRDDVRALIGWTVKEEDVPGESAVVDRWLALGRTVEVDERLTTARTWLLGEASGRWALHLAFAPAGTPPPIVTTGGSLNASASFFPSAAPLRAVLRDGATAGAPVTRIPHGRSLADAAAAFGRILADDPYLDRWPMALADVVPLGTNGPLVLRDAADDEIPVGQPGLCARLLAFSGGEPITAVGFWSGGSFEVLSAFAGGRLADMATERTALVDTSTTATAANPAWQRLVNAALLGTERLGEDRSQVQPGDQFGHALESRDAESALLAMAAIATVQRRAAWVPPTSDRPTPGPAARDARPVVGRAAAWQLRRILVDRPELLDEWLDLARPTGRVPPDEELPRLLTASARDPATRDALAPLLGARASWLVAQLPEFGAGLGPTAGDASASFEAATTPTARAVAIAAVRVTQPAVARDLVARAWMAASPEERARMVRAMETGLEAGDEPLLEQAARDKRVEVRTAAADLLARLPGSAFTQLAATTARPLLSMAGRFRPSLQVTLPTWEPTLEQLAISRKPPNGIGERAWWLQQLLARVDPAEWETWMAADPPTLIDRALRADDAGAVIEGWVRAAVWFRNTRWAAALLRDPDVIESEVSRGSHLLDLLGVLEGRERDATVVRLLKGADADQAARLVSACQRPWSLELTRASLASIAREAGKEFPAQGFYDHLRIAARRASPFVADELEATVLADERRRRSVPIIGAIDVLRSRQQLAQAFDEERQETR